MASPHSTTAIAGAGGLWGDQVLAPISLLERAEIDYITMDYLAELTMSIMHKQMRRDPAAGWATDLYDWLKAGGMDLLRAKKVHLVTNGGGANPRSCAEAILGLACTLGWTDCRIAIVQGDDLLEGVPSLVALETMTDMVGLPIEEELWKSLISANAYLGAGPIARALERGADIVITGRVTDSSLIIGSMLHAEGWAKRAEEQGLALCGPVEKWAPPEVKNPLDILAGWTMAGHLIECGAQVTGGNADAWADIPDLANVGYPIAEISSDGTCVITKPKDTGGAVTRSNVAEQLLYEIGDPADYRMPDVILDLRYVELEQVGENRVLVTGALGKERPEGLKVSASITDGWFATSTLLVPGPDAIAKALLTDQILRERLSEMTGLTIHTEMPGTGETMPNGGLTLDFEPPEVLLRWAVTSQDHQEVETFARTVAPLVLTGPAGVCGYSARARPRAQLRFIPMMVERVALEESVNIVILNTLRQALCDRRPGLEIRVFNRLQRIADWERKGLTQSFANRVLKGLERPVTGKRRRLQ